MGAVANFICGYYYEQLGIDQKCLYRTLGRAVADFAPSVTVDEQDARDIHKVMVALKYDNPEFFYFSPEDVEIMKTTVFFYYFPAQKEETEELVKSLRKKRKTLVEGLKQEVQITNQKDMLYAIYVYLVKHVAYASDELQKPASALWIYDIQGPLLKGKAVCLGIALTVNYLCALVHIPSILITGQARTAGWDGNHGWNLVTLDGENYHLDVTCEITESDLDGPRYFLLKDRDLSDRQWAKEVYPAAI